jgi:hypothetical protein
VVTVTVEQAASAQAAMPARRREAFTFIWKALEEG